MKAKAFFVDPFDLKEHKEASKLIPKMSDKEWDDFLVNVKEVGIRQPLDINYNNEVLDGRHRLKVAKKLELEKIEVRQHDLTPEQEIKFVRDISIEQKILTVAQKHKIFTDSQEFIGDLYEKGRSAKTEGGKKGADITNKNGFGPTGPKPDNHNTNKEIGKQIGTSKNTVKRLNKVKKESPESYEKVVNGEETPAGAYNKLPSVKNNKKKNDGTTERKEKDISKTEKQSDSKPKRTSNLYDFQNQDVSEEEQKELFLQSNNETIKGYLSQMTMLLNRIEDLDEVITLHDDDKDFFIEHVKTIDFLQETINKNYGSVLN